MIYKLCNHYVTIVGTCDICVHQCKIPWVYVGELGLLLYQRPTSTSDS